MFGWLKRLGSAPPKRAKAPSPSRPRPVAPGRTATNRRFAPRPGEPPPLPEVIAEGSTEADWSAWEDSMTALDSQIQGLVPTNRVYVRDTRPSQLDEPDPFASVHRKRE